MNIIERRFVDIGVNADVFINDTAIENYLDIDHNNFIPLLQVAISAFRSPGGEREENIQFEFLTWNQIQYKKYLHITVNGTSVAHIIFDQNCRIAFRLRETDFVVIRDWWDNLFYIAYKKENLKEVHIESTDDDGVVVNILADDWVNGTPIRDDGIVDETEGVLIIDATKLYNIDVQTDTPEEVPEENNALINEYAAAQVRSITAEHARTEEEGTPEEEITESLVELPKETLNEPVEEESNND